MTKSKANLQKLRSYDWKKLFFELIVVFLGVTAGFLLNNWQLKNQDRIIEKKYLSGFLQDVDANIIELENAISSDSLWLSRVKPNLFAIQNGTISTDSANTMLIQIIGVAKLETQTSTYEDITYSGNLNIITDFNLKKQIVDYHIALAGVKFIDDYFYDYFNTFVMPFIFANFSFLNATLDNPEIRKTIEFENVIAGYYSMVQQRQSGYYEVLQKSYKLKKALVLIYH